MKQIIDVKKVSKLANLPLEEAEIPKYTEELSQILDFINQLDEVNTEDVNPSYSSITEINKFQSSNIDATGNLDIDSFLELHRNTQDRYIKTSKVLDN